jgi:pyridoxine/pyridoxamine 5'-phosphate oxidase
MSKEQLQNYLQSHRLATLATRDEHGAPQAALIGVALTADCEIVFDTLSTTRKHANLVRDPRAALVFAGPAEQTAQYQGVAIAIRTDRDDNRRYLDAYFTVWPEGRGRANWPAIAYWRIVPRWARFSDYAQGPLIEEFRWPA